MERMEMRRTTYSSFAKHIEGSQRGSAGAACYIALEPPAAYNNHADLSRHFSPIKAPLRSDPSRCYMKSCFIPDPAKPARSVRLEGLRLLADKVDRSPTNTLRRVQEERWKRLRPACIHAKEARRHLLQ